MLEEKVKATTDFKHQTFGASKDVPYTIVEAPRVTQYFKKMGWVVDSDQAGHKVYGLTFDEDTIDQATGKKVLDD